MKREKIKAKEYYIKDLFSEKFLFEVPNYQRPYSWTEENIRQFMDDILDAIENNRDEYGDDFESYEPYFIGSVILSAKELKDDGSGIYDIIDGQQRITTITILIAVIRELIENKEYKGVLSSLIYQRPNALMGIKESIRLKARDKEQEFFRKYILEEENLDALLNLNREELNEAKQNMITAINIFIESFKDDDGIVDQNLLNTFIMYLLQRVVLVAMTTDSFTSAFKLFNIINARGVPLTNADLLKSDNLRAIEEDEQDRYTELWEDCEDDIGREKLEMLIGFIRSIKLKKKAINTIFEEFSKKVFEKEPEFRGKNFIEYLAYVKDLYEKYIVEAKINTEDEEKNTYYNNLISVMRDFIPFNEWIAVIIRFMDKFKDEEALYKFLKSFERKVVVDWINGLSFSERTTRLYKMISIIEQSKSVEEVLNNDMFNSELRYSKSLFYNSLNDVDFYTKGRMIIPKYVLIRMDMEKSNPGINKLKYTNKIIVEHMLPRRPSNPYWKDRFSTSDRGVWANKLANLILINGAKNSQASAKPFKEKMDLYVCKKGDFNINKDLSINEDWNIEVISKRQNNMINEAMKLWM